MFFANISKSRILVKNPALSPFYLYSSLTSCRKSEKSLEPLLRKLRYQPTNQPTNQPIITNRTGLIGPGWRRSNNKILKQNHRIKAKYMKLWKDVLMRYAMKLLMCRSCSQELPFLVDIQRDFQENKRKIFEHK